MRLSPLVQLAARRPRVVWVLVALVTLVLASGLPRLRIQTDLFDWMPRSHPNVVAFRTLFEKLPNAASQELLWLELDPEKARSLGVERITDHRAFLAQEELVDYLRARAPGLGLELGALAFLRSSAALGSGTAGTNAGSSPRVPGAFATRLLWAGVSTLASGPARAIVSADEKGTLLGFALDAPPKSPAAEEIAGALERAILAYREDPDLEHDLFREEFLVPVGLASGARTIDAALGDLIATRAPIALAAVGLALWLFLGGLRAAVIVLGLLGVGCVWTFGILGWSHGALDLVTILLVPLVLGSGVNHAILVASESLESEPPGLQTSESETHESAKARSHSSTAGAPASRRDAALERVAASSATAVVLTTCTSAAGLLVLAFADAPGLARLGLHAALSLAALALLSIACLPALITQLEPRAPGRSARFSGALAASLARRRGLVLTLFFALVIVFGVLGARQRLLLDAVGAHFHPHTPVARALERMRSGCGGAFPEIVIVEGDVTSRETLATLERIRARLAESPGPASRFATLSVLDVLRLARAKGSLSPDREVASAGGELELSGATDDLARAAADPGLRPLLDLFVSADRSLSAILLLGGDAADFESVDALWRDLEARLAEVLGDPAAGDREIRASFLGYRTMAWLFTTYSLEWLRFAGLASALVVLAVSLIYLRRVRAALVIALVLGSSSLLWLGLLRIAGVWISIFLLFPLVFLLAIGSDHTLHLFTRLAREERKRPADAAQHADATRRAFSAAGWRAFSATGRAVAFAAASDALVFLIFCGGKLASLDQSLWAVSLAAVAVFLATFACVPTLGVGDRSSFRSGE